MGLDFTKLALANLQTVSQKAGVQNVLSPKIKFNTGILDKDTVSFTQTATKKAGFPFTDKTTEIESHHSINALNSDIRSVLKKIERGGECRRYENHILERVEGLDDEFAKLPPLEDDFVFYRGRFKNPEFERFNEDFNIIEAAKAGDIIVPDRAYSYGAFKKELAENWSNGLKEGSMIMEIHTPKGAKVSRNSEHGGEVVFPRGAEYRLVSKEKDNKGVLNVFLEYILPEK